MPRARVIYLGTEFTLRIGPDNSFAVQLFEGLVELHLTEKNNPFDDSLLLIAKDLAAKVAARSRVAESTPDITG